jgi:XisH protein
MPRKDIFHENVRTALEKDDWVVTDDPLQVVVDDTTIYIDLGIEPTYYADRNGEQIAVEIKSFRLQSSITSMYEALGKFCIYRTALRLAESPRTRYLAVPLSIYNSFFQRILIQEALKEYQVNLIVYDTHSNTISTWIKH